VQARLPLAIYHAAIAMATGNLSCLAPTSRDGAQKRCGRWLGIVFCRNEGAAN